MIIPGNNINLCIKFRLVLILAGIISVLQAVKAGEMYHTNRTFTPVEFNIQGTPTVDQLFMETEKLTETVKGEPIKIDTNGTYAIEKQTAIAIGFDSPEDAWDAAVAYNGTPSNYPGKIFDNVGWVRGTKSANGEWGAYLWVLQNRIAFQASTSAWWRATTNGVPVAITNVIVGSLGNYAPMSNVVDVGPHLDAATNNYPGDNQGEAKEFRVDITNVFYQLSIPDIWITPRSAVRCVGGSNVQYTVTGTNITQGVSWSLIPDLSGSDGAAFQSYSAWQATVTPGNLATNYKVRATSRDNTNFYDEVDLGVRKVDIVQTNEVGYVYCTNCVAFNLTVDSYTNVFWTISPNLGTNGAQFTSSQRWTGSGTNVWHGTNVWVYSGLVSNNYTIRASAIEDTNCTDTAVLEVLQPGFLDLNWLEATNEALHHTSVYQTNALVLRRADKFKVEAKLSKGYTNTCFNVWFQAIHNFDGTPKTNNVPVVETDLGATDWYCKLISVSNSADQTKTVQMEINIPSTNCPIGEYYWRAVVTPKALTNVVLDTTNFPGQVIILFNPWSTNDSVYMADDDERQEYVIRATGRIWKRTDFTDNKPVQVWRYAQFDTIALAVILSELNGQDSKERSDPIVVSRFFSARANSNGGGILEGRWDGNYTNGTDPSLWSGSDQILTQYTGNAVKYGQCWVFAGLLTSMLRCVGIPARPLTNYDSFHDRDGNKSWDHRYMQDAGGVWQLYSDASHPFEGYVPWNFHVWCDAWMKRPDRPGNDEWQAVDATPQETSAGAYQCGPAPLSAVKADAGGNYDVNFVYAEVSALKKTWQWISGVWVVQQTVPDLVGHDIRTKAVGTDDWQVITDDYK